MSDPRARLVTVFGAGGFIGRYTCEMLLKEGVRLRAACRDRRHAWFLQPLGDVGQVSIASADICSPTGVAEACRGDEAVVNLVGVLKGDFDRLHVEGARNVAVAAREAGARALVHISAIGADPAAESHYARTKGEGELAVRKAFPQATIIRPSLVFGPEDELTNRFATMAQLPFLPVVAPATRFQPVYVRDLAQAIAAAALQPERYAGRTFEIGGPEVMTMRELNARVCQMAGHAAELVDVPDFASKLLASFGFLPGSPITRDQWLMLQKDNVVAEGAEGLEAFGITPTPMAAVAPDWLGRYKRGGRFAPHPASAPASTAH